MKYVNFLLYFLFFFLFYFSFDEVHFGKFASYYLRRTFYFDVHPPLGRLIVALVSYLVGYDGHFDFENIGDSYIDNKVPYIKLRSGIALFGALIPPVVFLIMKNMKFSLPTAILVAALTIFDNGLVTQSRLILLDNMLLLFCFCTVLFWVKFWNERKNPFTPKWWINLALSGVFLGCTLGVKLVGLLVIALIGIATLVDLWRLLDINRKPQALSMTRFWQHFGARALCLIVIPISLYLSFFVVHFHILKYSGPGDGFMSPRFQRSLQGSEIVKLSVGKFFLFYFIFILFYFFLMFNLQEHFVNVILYQTIILLFKPFLTMLTLLLNTRIPMFIFILTHTDIHFVTKINVFLVKDNKLLVIHMLMKTIFGVLNQLIQNLIVKVELLFQNHTENMLIKWFHMFKLVI